MSRACVAIRSQSISSAEQRVDMLVADRFVRAIEDGVAQAAHARHQLDAEEAAQAEDWLALTLGVGMKRVGLDRRAVLHQPIKDVDRLPHAAGDEAGEQGDVGIGDVVVSDTAIAAIANVPGPHEIVLAELDVRAVGDRCATAAPMPGQREAGILVDHIDHRRLQLVGVDVLRVDPAQRLRRRDLGGVAGGLIGTEIAAVAEHGEDIALDGLCELRIGRRMVVRSGECSAAQCSACLRISRRCRSGIRARISCSNSASPSGWIARRQLLQVGRSVFVDAQFAVGRKSRIDLGGEPSSIRPSARRRNPRRARGMPRAAQ